MEKQSFWFLMIFIITACTCTDSNQKNDLTGSWELVYKALRLHDAFSGEPIIREEDNNKATLDVVWKFNEDFSIEQVEKHRSKSTDYFHKDDYLKIGSTKYRVLKFHLDTLIILEQHVIGAPTLYFVRSKGEVKK